MKRSIILEIICSLLILLFLYASISKWLDFGHFIRDMHNQPFPEWIDGFLVWIVPFSELLTAILLVFNKTRTAGLWISFGLITVFTLYIGMMVLHVFNNIPCGCGNLIRKMSWPQHLFFNLFFVIISAAGLLLNKKNIKINKLCYLNTTSGVNV